AARLEQAGAARVFRIPPAMLREDDAECRARVTREITLSLRAGTDTLVMIADEAAPNLRQGAALAQGLAALLAPAAGAAAGLFATGGETARALLARLGIPGIAMRCEIEPGVPLGITRGPLAIPIVTKAGAFGHDGTIENARLRLRGLLNGKD
ncbi:four-carbon acid sugar kinase family protein, partial [Roseomonas sp. GC11]|uniref:nucleotide-binding domain containing protein n=1 Tax=Roseomonas sp. GC11 TaxID=2950546 RepID=UPI00272E6009